MALKVIVASVSADVAHLKYEQHSTEGPANPYVFSYQAGRAPGHVDRQHTEVSDGSGVIRGSFSYVDPKNEVRTVQYLADENGFHPQLSHQNEDVEAVKLAKQKHINLYNRIAQEHANAKAHPADVVNPYSSYSASSSLSSGPKNSEAVARATQKHLTLYERIAAEHAAIGAQQEAERQAHEASLQQIPVAIHYE